MADIPPRNGAPRSLPDVLLRGFRRRCPACGKGRMFAGWLTLRDCCPECGEPLGHIRADDAPPYFTIFATGHVVVPAMLWLEQAAAPALWLHALIWVPLTLAMAGALLGPIKGAVVGAMWNFGLSGSEQGPPAD